MISCENTTDDNIRWMNTALSNLLVFADDFHKTVVEESLENEKKVWHQINPRKPINHVQGSICGGRSQSSQKTLSSWNRQRRFVFEFLNLILIFRRIHLPIFDQLSLFHESDPIVEKTCATIRFSSK
jgi:hypothetical protein